VYAQAQAQELKGRFEVLKNSAQEANDTSVAQDEPMVSVGGLFWENA
jgi:hypothetical protein